MVQYEPFSPLLVNATLPTREKGTNGIDGKLTPDHVDSLVSMNGTDYAQRDIPRSHKETDIAQGAIHPKPTGLSSSHGSPLQYCSKCHMRRPSQELLLGRTHDHSLDEEAWDGFCPDISMPNHGSPRSTLHHMRRHSGPCPENLIRHKYHDGRSSPTQITVKARTCHHDKSGYQHEYHWEAATPIENLSERCGLVEEPSEIEQRRRSMEKQAAEDEAETMHEEFLTDTEARPSGI